MKELFSVFFHLLQFDFIFFLIFDPFWIDDILLHNLLFHIASNINKHVGRCLWLYQFFLNLHFFGVELNWLIESTKIIFKHLLSWYLLDNFVIKLVPFIVRFDKIIIVAWLSPGTLVHQYCIKLVLLWKLA